MFYALAHIAPPPIVSKTLSAAKPVIEPMPSSAAPQVVHGSVFEMPAGLPAFLRKPVVVPKSDEYSEFATLASVAQQVGVSFSHNGPDYALYKTKVPFGRPVPSYEFLWYVGKSYIPGTVIINGSGAIRVVNQKAG